jgi:hypothetical protein
LDFSNWLPKLYLVQEVVEWKILFSYMGGKNLMNVLGSSGYPKKICLSTSDYQMKGKVKESGDKNLNTFLFLAMKYCEDLNVKVKHNHLSLKSIALCCSKQVLQF